MTAAELETYAAQVGALPILGNIAFFTVRELDYDRAQMATWMTELGLAAELLPRPDTPMNAFRKACKAANEKVKYQIPGTSHVAHILVRPMAPDDLGMSQMLVREVKDEGNRRLAFDTVGEARFYRQTVQQGKLKPGSERLRLTLQHDNLDAYESVKLAEVTARIERDYHRYSQFMDAMKVREFVRKYLHRLSGVPLRSSTWFIHHTASEELGRLRELLLRMGCDMDRVPLLQLEETKDLLVKAVVKDTNEELQAVIDEIIALRKDRKAITGNAYARVKARYTEALALSGRFTEWLDTTMDTAEETLTMATAQLAQLQKEMMS